MIDLSGQFGSRVVVNHEPLCERCSTPASKNIDLCPVHARMAQKESERP